MAIKTVYFPNLNSLRFIAVAFVMIDHIEQLKYAFGFRSFFKTQVGAAGPIGVILFFVLSGFLITTLLLIEKEAVGTIRIKDFYVRRILRIWPLYFFIIILGLFILPKFSFFHAPNYDYGIFYNHLIRKLALFFFILPNAVISIYGALPLVAQTWSIGVEEQFYAIWPVIMKFVKNKVAFIIVFIFIYFIIKVILYSPELWACVLHKDLTQSNVLRVIQQFWLTTKLDTMAIGGLFAIICRAENKLALKLRRIIFNKWMQYPVFMFTIFSIAYGIDYGICEYEVYSFLFAIIICNMALNPGRIINLEFKPINYLGKISYGLYMYHGIAIMVIIRLVGSGSNIRNIALYILSFALTILIAAVSYKYFEGGFIKRKTKFSSIVSGDNVNHE